MNNSRLITLEAAKEIHVKIIELSKELENKHGCFNAGIIVEALAVVSAAVVDSAAEKGCNEAAAEDFKTFFTEHFNNLPPLEKDEH